MHGGAADPTEMAAMMWKRAFGQAMSELQAEKLKKRIDATWGPVMEKAADAIFESMGKLWQSMLLRSSADKDLLEKLEKIYAEAQKQK